VWRCGRKGGKKEKRPGKPSLIHWRDVSFQRGKEEYGGRRKRTQVQLIKRGEGMKKKRGGAPLES